MIPWRSLLLSVPLAAQLGCGASSGAASDAGAGDAPSDVHALDVLLATDSAAGDAGDAGDGGGAGTVCPTTANTFVIGGHDVIYSGLLPLTLEGIPGWTAQVNQSLDGGASFITVDVGGGEGWQVELSSEALGQPLAVGSYDDAQLAGSEAAGHPGLSVSGLGTSCTSVSGSFVIQELTIAAAQDGGAPVVQSVTASYLQHCNGGSSENDGCIHYAAGQ